MVARSAPGDKMSQHALVKPEKTDCRSAPNLRITRPDGEGGSSSWEG